MDTKPKPTLQKNTKPLLDPPHTTGLLMPPHKPNRLKWWLLGIFLTVILGLAAAASATYIWYGDAIKAKSTQYVAVHLEVQPGASVEQVAESLQSKGVVKSSLATLIYMQINKKSNIKAGHYILSPSQTVAQVVDWLNEGKVDTKELTILPGKTVDQIKQTFIEFGFGDTEVEAAFAKKYTHALFKGRPANAGLEGYIYPETYFLSSEMGVEEVLNKGFDEFYKKITENKLESALDNRGYSLWEGITLASLIEREVKSDEDRRQVAQVIEKRLNEDMRLDIDATYEYAAKKLGVAATPDLDSPYNTRLHAGLPPGPISNFTLSALLAVANPASGDYLYYVTGDNGVNYFSRTLEEHEQKIQQYCQELCGTN